MESPQLVLLSRLDTLTRQMEVVANNIANTSTTGFKRQGVVFDDYIVNTESEAPQLHFVTAPFSYRDERTGAIQMTGNPLDVAIEGEGWFAVQTAGGPRYTRAGSFQLNDANELVTIAGLRVLDEGGAPITVPDGSNNIRITRTGLIASEQGTIAQLQVASFANPRLLREEGNSLFTTSQPAIPAANARIVQGGLEGSNVQSVTEITTMLDVSRSYQRIQNMLNSDHERLRNMVRTLTRPV